MIEKLTDEEIEFLETYYDPIAMSEILFSDYDKMDRMDDEDLAHIRLGQFSLLSYEYILDNDSSLSDKVNFNLRKGAGEIYCLSGRLLGKTQFVERVDLLLSMILSSNENCGFSSYDALHIRGVLEDIIKVLENHPFFILFQADITRSPIYRITLKNGYVLEGINMNLSAGLEAGKQFFQKHLSRLYIEECSFEPMFVYEKRKDAVSEKGCVFRCAGMTNFTKHDPCGQIFYDLEKKRYVLNLPQYINPNFDEEMNNEAIKVFGGEQSLGYRIYVKGEVVEEGLSVMDMMRIRSNYNDKKVVKVFEVTKETLPNIELFMIFDRPKNVDVVYVCADIGESAPTEIIIIFKINDKYYYTYNIILHGLTDKEQFKVFRYISKLVKPNYIGIDVTEGTGRAVYRSLEEIFKKENMCWVSFNEKIIVDYEKDENGKNVIQNGNFVPIEEYVSEWSIKHLRDILYSPNIELPLDYKLDKQLNGVRALISGQRILYKNINIDDHLFQAFQVFAISEWMNSLNLNNPVEEKKFCKSGVGG